ncbi:MAG: filamentous hemagglutinin N-terminal domain-containing protein, partial [Sedimentisphaerales bacterium]
MELSRKFSKRCYFKSAIVIVYFLTYCMLFNTSLPIALAGPEGAQVVNGQVSFQQSGYNTAITASDKSIINYSGFDIARPEIVQFIQPGSSASVLNRILSANPTNINGTLLANGRVFFVNPAGVYIGAGARVCVNQLVASGLNITNSDFINGQYNFVGGDGAVINSGDISAEKVYLIGRQVANSGSISCPAGYIVMASGDRVFLGEPGTDVMLEVDTPSLPGPAETIEGSGVLNEGTVDAAGGKIVLAAGDIYSQAISNTGSLSASVETGEAGQIKLTADGGQVTNTGTIEASGDNGGSITIDGGNVTLTADSVIHADATGAGDGGEVLIYADNLELDGVVTAAGIDGYILFDPIDILDIDQDAADAIEVSLIGTATVDVAANVTINLNGEIDSSVQTNDHTLNFKDDNANNDLTINLNDKIILGDNQTLTGDGTTINVASTGLIQNGIDVAATNATVSIATSGSPYTEDLTITTDGLELTSATGDADDVTIKGVANVDSGLFPLAAPNIEILGDDVTIHGFTIEGPDPVAGKYASGMVIGGLNVEVYDNKFLVTNADTWDDISQGIQTYYGGVNPAGTDLSGLNIHDNEFDALGDGTAGYEAIYINRVTTDPTPTGAVTIADNTFNGPLIRGITTERSNVTISGNTINTTLLADDADSVGEAFQGILVRDGALGNQQDVIISNNTISGVGAGEGFAQGIRIGTTGQTLTNITVQENTVTNNTTGVQVRSSADGVVVNNNAISGNTTYGVENMDTGNTLDASGNWYGTNTAAGVAAEVSANVDYTPWLDSGTDVSGDPGFQGDFSNLHVDDDSPQVGSVGRVQEGINLVSGSTVTVEPGTYNENLTVNKANLTLQSTSTTGTILTANNGVVVDILGGGDYFTLGGTDGKGFTINSQAGTSFLVQLANGPQNVEVSWNELDTTGNASMGISVGAAGASGLNINNNTFTAGDLGDGSIWGPDMVDVSVTNNTFTGPAVQAASGYAVQFAGVTGTSAIQDNIIDDYCMGIVIHNGTGTSGLSISGNEISDSSNGIRFYQYSPSTNGDMTTVTITENTLTGNKIGLRIGDGANVLASNFIIQNNSFSGNTTALANEHNSEDVVATQNYWGSADGPSGIGPGSGDPITTPGGRNVDYSPWWGGDYVGDPTHSLPWTWGTDDSIQDAVDLALAGDTINIIQGVYTENLTINKQFASVNFTGNGSVASEIDGTADLVNANLALYTQNNGALTLNTVTDTGTDSSLSVNTGNGTLNLDENVTANGGVTLNGGIINVGNDSSDKVDSDGAVSITGTGTVTTNGVVDPTTVSITSNNDVTINNTVTADNLITVTAGTDGSGSVTVDHSSSNTGSLQTTAAGSDITITAGTVGGTSGDILLVDDATIITSGGTGNGHLVTLNAHHGVITMDDGALINAGDGKIDMDAGGGNITLGGLLTTSNATDAITITTNAAVVDGGDTDVDVVAANGRLVIDAATGVGSADDIETTVASVDIDNSTSGDIKIDETDGLNIIKIAQATAGNIDVTANGAINGVTDDSTADVSGATVNLTAAAIGTATILDVAASTALNADTSVAGGNILIDLLSNTTIDDVKAGTGDVTLDATGYNIDADTDDSTADVSGATVNLIASAIGTGTILDVAASTALNADTSVAGGNILIDLLSNTTI